MTRTLELVRENLNPSVRIAGIVPTMYDARLAHDREAMQILRSSFGDLVCETSIPKTIKFAEAPVHGQSVLKYAPDSQAAEAYRQLAREVLDGRKI